MNVGEYKMKKLSRKCPICGCNDTMILEKINMKLPSNIKLEDNYNVVVCGDCGFTFADTASTQDDYNEYYRTCNMYSENGEVKRDATSNINATRYQLFNKYIKKDMRILDIGCGDGSFLLYLKEHGYDNLYGIDPSEKSIKKLQNKGIEGNVGNIFGETPNEIKRTFDVVICTAVIEHLISVDSFVYHLQEYLVDKEGKLFVDAPAVEGFEKYILKQPNYFNHEHINYFSLVSLDNLMHTNSFVRINLDEESYCICGSQKKELGLQGIYVFSAGCNKELIKDIGSEKSIRNYFNLVKKIEMDEQIKIKRLLERKEKIVIWGTGSYTMQLLEKYPELQGAVQYFVDNNETKYNMILCNKHVHNAKHLVEDGEKYTILICSMMNSNDIVEQIKNMGICNPYIAF